MIKYNLFVSKKCFDQSFRKSKIGGELTKNGCHIWSQGLSKKRYICSFQTNYPYYRGFYASFSGLIPIWLAISISASSFWLVDTQKNQCLKNQKKNGKAINLKIYLLVHGQKFIFNLGIPLRLLKMLTNSINHKNK